MHTTRTQSGYSVLVSVIMVTMIAMSIGLSLMFSSNQELKNTEIFQASIGAKALTNACVEDALEKLRRTNGTITEGDITLDGYTCQYTVTYPGSSNAVITAIANMGDITKTMTVTVSSYMTDISIDSWIES